MPRRRCMFRGCSRPSVKLETSSHKVTLLKSQGIPTQNLHGIMLCNLDAKAGVISVCSLEGVLASECAVLRDSLTKQISLLSRPARPRMGYRQH